MKKPTISAFINSSSIPAKLIRSTIRQIGGFDEFKHYVVDVTKYGASGGFGGFTYYSDTVSFTKRNKKEILQYASEMANDIGEKSAIELIAGFNCLQLDSVTVAEALFNPRSEDRTNVYNALARFALEEVSRAWADMQERD
jgi:hypothetical protein